jgi:hypothetical protein
VSSNGHGPTEGKLVLSENGHGPAEGRLATNGNGSGPAVENTIIGSNGYDPGMIYFLTDNSGQAERIRAFLDRSGLPYRAIPASGFNVPAVEYAGTRYDTLEGIFMVVHDLVPDKSVVKKRISGR